MLTPEEMARRFEHHAPRDEIVIRAHEDTRKIFRAAAETVDVLCPEGREKSLAITKIEEAMMWANAAIARQ